MNPRAKQKRNLKIKGMTLRELIALKRNVDSEIKLKKGKKLNSIDDKGGIE